jgi:hypothetical protein
LLAAAVVVEPVLTGTAVAAAEQVEFCIPLNLCFPLLLMQS